MADLLELNADQRGDVEKNVKAAINRLSSFAIPSGGMTYWPGMSAYAGASVWATIYATHFMIEAQKAGYSVPASLRKSNLSYLRTVASGKSYDADSRAYALYVLALAGSPDRGDMNRLREDIAKLPESCRLLLSGAYVLDGDEEVFAARCSDEARLKMIRACHERREVPFSMLGVKVTVVEMMSEILPMMDGEFAKLMRRELAPVEFNLGCKVTRITDTGLEFLDDKGVTQNVEAELVLMSVGRRPNSKGLESLGLEMNRAAVKVDETMRTSVANVYAIGDLNGMSQLAHSAMRMAEVAVDNIFGEKKQVMRYNAVPWAVYSNPEAAGCGLTETAAAKEGREVKCATTQMRANGRFLAENGKKAAGMVKVVSDAKTGTILGIHFFGPYSSEIIWGASALIENEMRVCDVKELIFPHPSVSELIRDTTWAIK
ncbi:MAG: FAD-dependent oxidoreductase [Sphaerochaetaceae bacterium]